MPSSTRTQYDTKKVATSKIYLKGVDTQYGYLQSYGVHREYGPVAECPSNTMGCMYSKTLYLLEKEGELFLDKDQVTVLGKSSDSSHHCGCEKFIFPKDSYLLKISLTNKYYNLLGV